MSLDGSNDPFLISSIPVATEGLSDLRRLILSLPSPSLSDTPSVRVGDPTAAGGQTNAGEKNEVPTTTDLLASPIQVGDLTGATTTELAKQITDWLAYIYF